MDEATLDFLKHKVANALMRAHGYDRRNPDTKTEFDPSEPESQFSMMLEDADIAVGTLLDTLMDLEMDDEESEEQPLLGVVQPEPKRSAVSISSALFIFMDTPPGEPTYVSDVRQWLDAIDDAQIPDDTEVEGTLQLSYDRQHNSATKIECGECGKFDTVLAEHYCPAWEEETDTKLF